MIGYYSNFLEFAKLPGFDFLEANALSALFNNLPEIISAAAESPLGITALAIIVASFICFFFFKDSSSKIRLVAFFFLLGVISFLTIGIVQGDLNSANNVTSCAEQLKVKQGLYKGTAAIVNLPNRVEGSISLDIKRLADTECDLVVDVEENGDLAGEGKLYGKFNPLSSSELKLEGLLTHQREPKSWDVKMNISFIDDQTIEGDSEWSPRRGVTDTNIYQEEFQAVRVNS